MSPRREIPDFDDLPKVEGMPQGCAWGIFDRDGEKDVYGTLNLLTPELIVAAAEEVREGISISLNWPLNGVTSALTGRKAPVHNVRTLTEMGFGSMSGWDDEIEFNTQCSSQWDSLCHYEHQESGLAYNGVKCSKERLTTSSSAENTMPTLDHWHERGGMVGRGVLIDYKAYADEKAGGFSPFDGTRITAPQMEEVARHQGVEFKHGDILVVRTGYTEDMESKNAEEQMAAMAGRAISGVESSIETARWVWDKHFAAVASDAPAFEVISPLNSDGTPWDRKTLVLHQWFLSMFGLPIGEMWDLKRLSAECKRIGRYTFMLTSVPLNLPGLIGSPPNVLAIL